MKHAAFFLSLILANLSMASAFVVGGNHRISLSTVPPRGSSTSSASLAFKSKWTAIRSSMALHMNQPTLEEIETEEMIINGNTTAKMEVSTAVVDGKKDGDGDGNDEKELTETQKLMRQVKEAGTAGVVSYALWELAFWFISVPVCAFGFREVTGHWPDFTNSDDLKEVGAEAFAFVNFARFAVPLRIGLALSTTPWIDKNLVKRFFNKATENGDGTPAEN